MLRAQVLSWEVIRSSALKAQGFVMLKMDRCQDKEDSVDDDDNTGDNDNNDDNTDNNDDD